jgi:hypothetical protein
MVVPRTSKYFAQVLKWRWLEYFNLYSSFDSFRAAQSSLADIEMKYNKAIERNAILEQEITTKDQLAEQVQRLKDDLNGKKIHNRCPNLLISPELFNGL